MACSSCGKPGHNKATCPSRPEDERATERARKHRSHRRPVVDVLNAILQSDGPLSLKDVGVALGVSGERARQLVNAHGLQNTRLALKEARRPTAEQNKRKWARAVAKNQSAKKKQWRASGKCPRAGCERDDGHVTCSRHRALERAANQRFRDKRRAKNFCPRCGGLPKAGCKTCQTCLDYINGRRGTTCPSPGDGQPAA